MNLGRSEIGPKVKFGRSEVNLFPSSVLISKLGLNFQVRFIFPSSVLISKLRFYCQARFIFPSSVLISKFGLYFQAPFLLPSSVYISKLGLNFQVRFIFPSSFSPSSDFISKVLKNLSKFCLIFFCSFSKFRKCFQAPFLFFSKVRKCLQAPFYFFLLSFQGPKTFPSSVVIFFWFFVQPPFFFPSSDFPSSVRFQVRFRFQLPSEIKLHSNFPRSESSKVRIFEAPWKRRAWKNFPRSEFSNLGVPAITTARS